MIETIIDVIHDVIYVRKSYDVIKTHIIMYYIYSDEKRDSE